jgi:predicted esterase
MSSPVKVICGEKAPSAGTAGLEQNKAYEEVKPMESFEDLATQMFEHYGAGDLHKALAVAESASLQYPEKVAKTAYWKACILSLMRRPEEAVSALEQGLSQGAWWAEPTLLYDPDLEGARASTRMEQVVAESGTRWRKEQSTAATQVFTLEPGAQTATHGPRDAVTSPAPPLMLAFHWRNGSGPEFINWFRPAAENMGFLLAAVQSSQMCAKEEYCWDDQAQGEQEVLQALASLRVSHVFDHSSTILAGASQGGRLAITMSLAGGSRKGWSPDRPSLAARGFIAVVPAIRDVDMFLPYAESAARRGVRGYIITGERDNFVNEASKLQTALKNAGVDCSMEVVKDMPHTFPKDFPDRLMRAIRFVMA